MKCCYCDVDEKLSELRPYGPNGAPICFDCGMEHEEETGQQFGAQLETCGEVAVFTVDGPIPLGKPKERH